MISVGPRANPVKYSSKERVGRKIDPSSNDVIYHQGRLPEGLYERGS